MHLIKHVIIFKIVTRIVPRARKRLCFGVRKRVKIVAAVERLRYRSQVKCGVVGEVAREARSGMA